MLHALVNKRSRRYCRPEFTDPLLDMVATLLLGCDGGHTATVRHSLAVASLGARESIEAAFKPPIFTAFLAYYAEHQRPTCLFEAGALYLELRPFSRAHVSLLTLNCSSLREGDLAFRPLSQH